MTAYPECSIPKMHIEYHAWVNVINFYLEEIMLFEKRLDKIAHQGQQEKLKAKVQQFTNQFIWQKEVLNVLKYDLHRAEKDLISFVHQMRGMGLSCVKMDNHPQLREDLKTVRKEWIELKSRCRRFEVDCLAQEIFIAAHK